MGQITNGKDGGLSDDQMEVLSQVAITGDLSAIERLVDSLDREIKQELLRAGGPIAATIDELQREYLSYVELMITLSQAEAVKTLAEVMKHGDKDDTPRIQAANSILDRGNFPKRARQERLNLTISKNESLPSLDELTKAAGDDETVKDFLDGFTALLKKVDKHKDD